MPDETPKPTETETPETTPLAEADLDDVAGGIGVSFTAGGGGNNGGNGGG